MPALHLVLLALIALGVFGCDDDEEHRQYLTPEVLWSRTLNSDWGHCISPTEDGGFVAFISSSWSYTSAELYRFTSDGELLDSVSLTEVPEDRIYRAVKAAGGGVWIAYESEGLVLQRYDENLDLVQDARLSGYNMELTELADTHHGLVATCRLEDSSNVSRAVLMMLDYSGNVNSIDTLQVDQQLPEGVSVRDYLHHIAVSQFGTIFVAGQRCYMRGGSLIDSTDILVAMANAQGEIQWVNREDNAEYEYVGPLIALPSGHALIAADTSRDNELYYFEVDPDGRKVTREDLTAWFEGITTRIFVTLENGLLAAVGYRSYYFVCDLVVSAMTSEAGPRSQMFVQEGIEPIVAETLDDGSLAAIGYYPTDALPAPITVVRVRF